MARYEIGDSVEGPVNCARCGTLAPVVRAAAHDEDGRVVWSCEACFVIPDVSVVVEKKVAKKEGKVTTETKTTKTAKAGKAAAIGVQEFTKDKETDNCVRVRADNDKALFGSIYVKKDAWPKGAVGIRFVPEFVIG